jgi:murein DD-endopeptidase MepM/ murein hydrolase activator NlpD
VTRAGRPREMVADSPGVPSSQPPYRPPCTDQPKFTITRLRLRSGFRDRTNPTTVLTTRAPRQRIDRANQRGIYSCPMARPFTFIDSWGFARSGGRAHKGVDIMAPRGNEIYAFTNGRVQRMKTGGLGGVVLYLRGDDGNVYYYAHLDRYAPGIGTGSRVEAGQLIAYNGDTGNARGAPHLHFEVAPGGGAAVNPYPYTAAACF